MLKQIVKVSTANVPKHGCENMFHNCCSVGFSLAMQIKGLHSRKDFRISLPRNDTKTDMNSPSSFRYLREDPTRVYNRTLLPTQNWERSETMVLNEKLLNQVKLLHPDTPYSNEFQNVLRNDLMAIFRGEQTSESYDEKPTPSVMASKQTEVDPGIREVLEAKLSTTLTIDPQKRYEKEKWLASIRAKREELERREMVHIRPREKTPAELLRKAARTHSQRIELHDDEAKRHLEERFDAQYGYDGIDRSSKLESADEIPEQNFK